MIKNLTQGIINLGLILILLFTSLSEANCQNIKNLNAKKLFNEHLYLGIYAGKSNYIGDLNNNNRWDSQFDGGISGIIGYEINPVFGIRIQYVNGSLTATSENDYKKLLDTKYWDCGYQVLI